MDEKLLRAKLADGVAIVTFKKLNGDIREMHCTLNGGLIPPSAWPTGKVILTEETKAHTMRVYDTKASGWRSFVIDSVISVA